MITYEEARALVSSGDCRKASEHFKLLATRSKDSAEKANFLIERAECLRQLGEFENASAAVVEAKQLVGNDEISSDQIDYLAATLLIPQGKYEEGVRALLIISKKYSNTLDGEGRELYEQAQIQCGFGLMSLGRYADARIILEEVVSFGLPSEYRRDVHSQLGSCYFELGLYSLAREQFQEVQALGVSDEWAPAYHYEFGFTLYELSEFAAAKRGLLLCLQSGTHGPRQSYVYKLLAATYRQLGDPEQARLYQEAAKPSK
jgi:tetratricopeptide (TPR) repeat protein